MPNWTSNSIRAEGDEHDIAAFLEAVKWQDEIFDFNRVIPMPEILKHTGTGRCTIDGKRVTSWYVINEREPLPDDDNVRLFTPEEEAALAEMEHHDWYSWRNANWGTKWNACHSEIADACINHSYVEIRFDTAWDAPLPVFFRMFELFPKLSFTCSWQYEDQCIYSIADEAEAA